jgi:predicted ABC-type ATPase
MEKSLRLRVFAGPNGSGKSTVINSVREFKVADRPIDFGIYINADDIARELRDGSLDLTSYQVNVDRDEFVTVVGDSGLLSREFTKQAFLDSFILEGNRIQLVNDEAVERLAQIIADFLRKRLLAERKKFSFETVFSHSGKLDFMRQAAEQGYKVYLYFVSTQDPEINVYRVKQVRVQQNGHDVPEDKIRSRYSRSMGLMYEAAQLSYQAFFFDNSTNAEQSMMFARFRNVGGEKEWIIPDSSRIPSWFNTYYSESPNV